MTGEPIPDRWFIENKLAVAEFDAGLQDPDGDGFLNEDEWRYGTNSRNKDSHPPYYTKLFLVARVGPTLRLKFTTFEGDLKQVGLKGMTFQINAWAGKWRTIFMAAGEKDAPTGLEIVSFREPGSLTVKLAGEVMVLPLGEEVEGPKGAAQLRDDLGAGTEFVVKTGQAFSLKAEPDVPYKLLKLSSAGATIEFPDGKSLLVPPHPAANGRCVEWFSPQKKGRCDGSFAAADRRSRGKNSQSRVGVTR